MNTEMKDGPSEGSVVNTLVRWRSESPLVVEAIQKLLTDGSSIDVRVRCCDHQPSEGLGAHKLVLAAASPEFLKLILPDSSSDDELICVNLPDFSSMEVGPVMSLLYFGEIWLSEDCVFSVQKILDTLRISVKLIYDSTYNLYALVPRDKKYSRHIPDTATNSVIVKCEEPYINTASHLETDEEAASLYSQQIPKRCLSTAGGSICKVEVICSEEQHEEPTSVHPLLDLKLLKREPVDECDVMNGNIGGDDGNSDDLVNPCDVIVTDVVKCNEPGCSFSTSSLSSVQAHRLVHYRKRMVKDHKLSCPVCGISESSQKALKTHAVETHGELDGDRVQCRVADSCQLFFDSRESFFEHLTSSHNDTSKIKISRQLFCDFPHCYFVTEKSFNLAQHLRKHNDERSFACSSCGLRFRSSSHVKAHFRARHTAKNLAKQFGCVLCDKSFVTSWQLKSHSKTHLGKLEGQKHRYKCGHCESQFDKPQSLAGHVRSAHRKLTESNRKVSNVCETCGQSVTLLSKHQCLKDKLLPLDGGDVVTMSVCPICQKELPASGLKNHLHYHKKKEEEGLHVCQYCNKTFTTQHSLQRHSLIHEDAKPFKCQVCDKTFRQKGSLESHRRVHTGVRVSCRACGLRFITTSLLNQHLKRKVECRVSLQST